MREAKKEQKYIHTYTHTLYIYIYMWHTWTLVILAHFYWFSGSKVGGLGKGLGRLEGPNGRQERTLEEARWGPSLHFSCFHKILVLAAATAVFDQNWPSRPRGVAKKQKLQHLADEKAIFCQNVLWLWRGSIFCWRLKNADLDPILPPLGSSLASRWGLLSAQGPSQGPRPPWNPKNKKWIKITNVQVWPTLYTYTLYKHTLYTYALYTHTHTLSGTFPYTYILNENFQYT